MKQWWEIPFIQLTESGSGFGFGILLNKFLKVSLVVLIGFLFRVCERVCDCVRARASVSFVVCTSTMIGHTFTFCYIRKKKAEFSNNWLFLKQINYCHQLVALFFFLNSFLPSAVEDPQRVPRKSSIVDIFYGMFHTWIRLISIYPPKICQQARRIASKVENQEKRSEHGENWNNCSDIPRDIKQRCCMTFEMVTQEFIEWKSNRCDCHE